MKDLVEIIMKDRTAPQIIKRLQEKWAAEQQKRQEFYNLVHENVRAEFVNGKVIIHSPVKKRHNDVVKRLSRLLDMYVEKHELGYVGVEKVMTVFTRNDYEPDICFFKKEKSEQFTEGQSLFPVPDLAVEILSSNKKHDRETKYQDYEAHEVKEYWIIDPQKKYIEQYRLHQKKYDLVLKSKDGSISSEVVKGFTIPIKAIFNKEENWKVMMGILSI